MPALCDASSQNTPCTPEPLWATRPPPCRCALTSEEVVGLSSSSVCTAPPLPRPHPPWQLPSAPRLLARSGPSSALPALLEDGRLPAQTPSPCVRWTRHSLWHRTSALLVPVTIHPAAQPAWPRQPCAAPGSSASCGWRSCCPSAVLEARPPLPTSQLEVDAARGSGAPESRGPESRACVVHLPRVPVLRLFCLLVQRGVTAGLCPGVRAAQGGVNGDESTVRAGGASQTRRGHRPDVHGCAEQSAARPPAEVDEKLFVEEWVGRGVRFPG